MNSQLPDLVNHAEIARRLVAQGIAVTMSRERIGQLRRDDPAFPYGEKRGGQWWHDWAEIERYFRQRQPQTGRPRKERPLNQAAADQATHA